MQVKYHYPVDYKRRPYGVVKEKLFHRSPVYAPTTFRFGVLRFVVAYIPPCHMREGCSFNHGWHGDASSHSTPFC